MTDTLFIISPLVSHYMIMFLLISMSNKVVKVVLDQELVVVEQKRDDGAEQWHEPPRSGWHPPYRC